MTIQTTATPMTAEAFCDWVQRPENANRWFELVRGEVIELPAPTKPHGVVCLTVGRLLGNWLDEQGWGYVTSNDSGVILERDPDTVRGPDVAVYNDATAFAELHPKYGEVPPLLAVEVLSPQDRTSKVMRKVTDYLRAGVRLVWLLDPESRDATVCRPGREPIVVEQDQELTGEDVLPGFRCPVRDVFRLPGERPRVEPAPP
jgi:Uma2 family endonuclease